MRCGNKLISKGDMLTKVAKHCGEPVQTERRLGLRRGVYLERSDGYGSKESVSRGHFISYGRREVVVEIWVMNFGPNKLMRRITFEDGFVERIEELDYGYRE